MLFYARNKGQDPIKKRHRCCAFFIFLIEIVRFLTITSNKYLDKKISCNVGILYEKISHQNNILDPIMNPILIFSGFASVL